MGILGFLLLIMFSFMLGFGVSYLGVQEFIEEGNPLPFGEEWWIVEKVTRVDKPY